LLPFGSGGFFSSSPRVGVGVSVGSTVCLKDKWVVRATTKETKHVENIWGPQIIIWKKWDLWITWAFL
jgi:hypothetical protein